EKTGNVTIYYVQNSWFRPYYLTLTNRKIIDTYLIRFNSSQLLSWPLSYTIVPKKYIPLWFIKQALYDENPCHYSSLHYPTRDIHEIMNEHSKP
ncbi:MAG: hypothetical protein F7B61_06645, partial [Caldisphaeraceae archaeon]|nr:hypothetical protein [Caldisphaeraceae archaeon]